MSKQNSADNRYARQRQFKPIGDSGQRSIESADVSILGCGALGTVAAEILCRAGVGTIRLIDRDIVEWTNLQRQALYIEDDARQGAAKAEVATARLTQINSSIRVQPHVIDVSPDNVADLLGGTDLVVDASDNFSLRLLLNDWSLFSKTPWVHGGCVGGAGQVGFFTGQGSPCFRCLVSDVPPPGTTETCDTAGVVGAATHAIASLQTVEALKFLSGNSERLRTKILSIDFWNNRQREVAIGDALTRQCPACSRARYDFLDATTGHSDHVTVLCGREAVQIDGESGRQLDLGEIEKRWQQIGNTQASRFFLRLHLDGDQSLTLFRDGRAVIAGTDQPSVARGIYDRYVGR